MDIDERLYQVSVDLGKLDAKVCAIRKEIIVSQSRAADLNESERGELVRLRAIVAKLGDAEMVVPCHWENTALVTDGELIPLIDATEPRSEIEAQLGVIRLREPGGGEGGGK
jgi:hypothetical protein